MIAEEQDIRITDQSYIQLRSTSIKNHSLMDLYSQVPPNKSYLFKSLSEIKMDWSTSLSVEFWLITID